MAVLAAKGTFTLDQKTLMITVLCMLYVTPIDFIFGLADDIGLVILTVSELKDEIARFKAWHKEKLDRIELEKEDSKCPCCTIENIRVTLVVF